MRRHPLQLIEMLLLAPLCVGVLIAAPARAEHLSARQRLAMIAKPAVVRILDGYTAKWYWPKTRKTYDTGLVASGSGFFINPDGYIVTNAHVVDRTRLGKEKALQQLFTQFVIRLAKENGHDPAKVLKEYGEQIRQQVQLIQISHLHHVIIADGTSKPFEIKSAGAPVGSGEQSVVKDVAVIKIEVHNAPTLQLAQGEPARVLEWVMALGYPAAADTFSTGLLSQKSSLQASITAGSVSAIKEGADGAPALQISAPATHGNSGGPVVNEHGEVIGIVTFGGDRVNGQEIGGFTFVVSSQTILEYVRQSGATNREGLTDRRYRQGLASFWNDDYRQAIARFEEVKRLFPQHPETDRLIRVCQETLVVAEEKLAAKPRTAKLER